VKSKKIKIEVYYKDVNGVGFTQTYAIEQFIPLTDKQTIIGYKIIEV